MSYITGTLTDANPGPALYALMAPALTTAGYTLVDTVVISTRTHKIWKSAAANNSAGLDWYLDVAYTTAGAGNFWLTPFEYFDPATDLGYRGPYANAASTTIETTYYSRYGATGSALETNWVGANQTVLSLIISTSSFGYWISVTGDRCIALTSLETNYLLYAGMYTPDPVYASKAGSAVFPLVTAHLNSNSANQSANSGSSANSSSAAITRLPLNTALITSGWGTSVQIYKAMESLPHSSPQIPTGSVASYPFVAWPMIVVGHVSGASASVCGTLIGAAQSYAAGTVVRGDTCTISGEAWVFGTPVSNTVNLFKAA